MRSPLLGPIEPHPKTGNEPFHQDGVPLDYDVLSFWRWFASDLLNNTTRGILAEYLVARALGGVDGARWTWDPYDVTTPDGIRVEVKSAAYLQSWHQERVSQIGFSTRPTLGWDAATNAWDSNRRRQADVYVFCLLAHQDKASVDPLNVAQWRFFVLAARRLDEALGEQNRVGLTRLLAIGAQETPYRELTEAVKQMVVE